MMYAVAGLAVVLVAFAVGRGGLGASSAPTSSAGKVGGARLPVYYCAKVGGVAVKGSAELVGKRVEVVRAKGYRFVYSPQWTADVGGLGLRLPAGRVTADDDARRYIAYYDVAADGTVMLYDTGWKLARSGVSSDFFDQVGAGISGASEDWDAKFWPALYAKVIGRVTLGDPRTCADGRAALAQLQSKGYFGDAVIAKGSR